MGDFGAGKGIGWMSLDDRTVHARVGRQERAVNLRYDVHASRGYCRHPPRATEGPKQAASRLTTPANAGILFMSGPFLAMLYPGETLL